MTNSRVSPSAAAGKYSWAMIVAVTAEGLDHLIHIRSAARLDEKDTGTAQALERLQDGFGPLRP